MDGLFKFKIGDKVKFMLSGTGYTAYIIGSKSSVEIIGATSLRHFNSDEIKNKILSSKIDISRKYTVYVPVADYIHTDIDEDRLSLLEE